MMTNDSDEYPSPKIVLSEAERRHETNIKEREKLYSCTVSHSHKKELTRTKNKHNKIYLYNNLEILC